MIDEDLYAILGISPSATQDEIKDAYRRQAMKWHPDRNPGNKEQADEQFKRIAYAYKILYDQEERAKYDAWRASQQDQQEAKGKQYSSAAQGPGVSEEDAAAIFYEQMLDLAFELAKRGYTEGTIGRTLIELDCPASIARAAAASAVKLAGPLGGFSSGRAPDDQAHQNDQPTASSIESMSWDQAAPYYAAIVGGDYAGDRMSQDRYEAVSKKRGRRYYQCSGACAIAGALIAALSLKGWDIVGALFIGAMVGALVGLLLAVISLLFSRDRRAWMSEHAMRYYLPVFECFHNARPLPKKLSGFNVCAWLGTIFWVAYRRMPLFAIVSVIAIAVVTTIQALYEVDHPALSKPSNALSFGLAIAMGIMGNRLYFLSARTRIRKFISDPRDQALSHLRQAGGGNWWSVIGFTALFFLLLWPAISIEESAQEKQAAIAAQAAEAQRQANLTPEARWANVLAQEQKFYDAAVREYETRYPEINPDSPRYDQSFTVRLKNQKEAYERQGLSSTQALRRAMTDLGRP